jgi:hypothetical protein
MALVQVASRRADFAARAVRRAGTGAAQHSGVHRRSRLCRRRYRRAARTCARGSMAGSRRGRAMCGSPSPPTAARSSRAMRASRTIRSTRVTRSTTAWHWPTASACRSASTPARRTNTSPSSRLCRRARPGMGRARGAGMGQAPRRALGPGGLALTSPSSPGAPAARSSSILERRISPRIARSGPLARGRRAPVLRTCGPPGWHPGADHPPDDPGGIVAHQQRAVAVPFDPGRPPAGLRRRS